GSVSPRLAKNIISSKLEIILVIDTTASSGIGRTGHHKIAVTDSGAHVPVDREWMTGWIFFVDIALADLILHRITRLQFASNRQTNFWFVWITESVWRFGAVKHVVKNHPGSATNPDPLVDGYIV